MRMEDLDPPREQPGAAEDILWALRQHGLHWDGDVLWQSRRQAAYGAVVEHLLANGLAFYCDCSRAQLRAEGGVYQGRCRDRGLGIDADAAVRLMVDTAARITIDDLVQAPLTQALATDVGDFVIHRRDGLFAYQLAVVVDDAFQGVNTVLRGSDLYDSTPRQVFLQQLLGLPTPRYAHIPVIENAQGQKLSKQTHAPALDPDCATDNLRLALRFLQQPAPPADLQQVEPLLAFAVAHWDLGAVPRRAGIPESSLY
jgi:glutamyl-Q tRNA(Asp) synthetase